MLNRVEKEVRQRELRGRAAPSAMLQERFTPEDQAPTAVGMEAKEARWREVEAGTRNTIKSAMERYPQLTKYSCDGLPSEVARQPKNGNGRAYDVKTYLASDVDDLVARLAAPDQEPVDPRWLEVEAGTRYTRTTAMERYPQLTIRSFVDLPFEIARQPKQSDHANSRARDVKTYLAAHVDALAEGRAWEDAGGGGGGDGDAPMDDSPAEGSDDDGGDDDGAGGDDGAGDDGSAKRQKVGGGDGAGGGDEDDGDGDEVMGGAPPPPPPPRPLGAGQEFLQDAPDLESSAELEGLRRLRSDAPAKAAARDAYDRALAGANLPPAGASSHGVCYCVAEGGHCYDSTPGTVEADVAEGVMAALAFALGRYNADDARLRVYLRHQSFAALESGARDMLQSDRAVEVVRALEIQLSERPGNTRKHNRERAHQVVMATLFSRHHCEVKTLVMIKFDDPWADILMWTTLPDCDRCGALFKALGFVFSKNHGNQRAIPPRLRLSDDATPAGEMAPALYYVPTHAFPAL